MSRCIDAGGESKYYTVRNCSLPSQAFSELGGVLHRELSVQTPRSSRLRREYAAQKHSEKVNLTSALPNASRLQTHYTCTGTLLVLPHRYRGQFANCISFYSISWFDSHISICFVRTNKKIRTASQVHNRSLVRDEPSATFISYLLALSLSLSLSLSPSRSFFFFFFGATAPRGPGPPHSRGL